MIIVIIMSSVVSVVVVVVTVVVTNNLLLCSFRHFHLLLTHVTSLHVGLASCSGVRWHALARITVHSIA